MCVCVCMCVITYHAAPHMISLQEPVHIRYKELLHVKEQLEKHVDELRKELAARQTHESPRV